MLRRWLVTVFFLFIAAFVGCRFGAPGPAALKTETVFFHPITYQGETLEVIALWYTGNGSHWRLLKNYNGEVRQFVLPIGRSIRIPGHLMTRTDLMPEDFVRQYRAQVKSKKRAVKKHPQKEEGRVSNADEEEEEFLQAEPTIDVDPQDELIDKMIDPAVEP